MLTGWKGHARRLLTDAPAASLRRLRGRGRTEASLTSLDLRARGAGPAEDAAFVTSDGRRLPVERKYRYASKAGWRIFPPLAALDILARRGRLSDAESARFSELRGERTLAAPLAEISAFAAPLIARHPDCFLPETLDGEEPPEAARDDAALAKEIRTARARIESRFVLAGAPDLLRPPRGARALEIGYSTGIPLFALESLGYETSGIDNAYGGAQARQGAHVRLAAQTRSAVRFLCGDVTRRTDLDDGAFDLIVSESVIEHLLDLPAALAEMARLLRPGGRMVHIYLPFLSPLGGHSLGLLDTPWGHARLSAPDFERYLLELRAHEAATASAWCAAALTTRFPIGAVQRAVAGAGLRLRRWVELPAPRAQLDRLTPGILGEVLCLHPMASANDLLTDAVLFVAERDDGPHAAHTA